MLLYKLRTNATVSRDV